MSKITQYAPRFAESSLRNCLKLSKSESDPSVIPFGSTMFERSLASLFRMATSTASATTPTSSAAAFFSAAWQNTVLGRLNTIAHRIARKHKKENFVIALYSICTSSPVCDSAVPAGAGCCGSRQPSTTETWCTHDTVQCGAQPFSVRYSRRISATEYCSSGIAG
jgi:hypothetical protein